MRKDSCARRPDARSRTTLKGGIVPDGDGSSQRLLVLAKHVLCLMSMPNAVEMKENDISSRSAHRPSTFAPRRQERHRKRHARYLFPLLMNDYWRSQTGVISCIYFVPLDVKYPGSRFRMTYDMLCVSTTCPSPARDFRLDVTDCSVLIFERLDVFPLLPLVSFL
jgi:hypothetical protein